MSPASVVFDSALSSRWDVWGTVAFILLASTGASFGDSSVRLTHSGNCPGIQGVRDSLKTEAISIDGEAPLTAQITTNSGYAYVSVRRENRILTARKVASDDCEALAETFALIIANAVRDWMTEQQSADENILASDSSKLFDPEDENPLDVSVPVSTPLPPPAKPIRERRLVIDSVSFGVALGIALAKDSRPGFAKLDTNFCSKWCLGLSARATDRALASMLNRQQFNVAATVGRQWDREDVRLRASVGAAWLLTHLTSDASANETRSYTALVGTAVVFVPITERLSMEAEISGFVTPQVDRFLLNEEVVGVSPRFQAFTSFGFTLWTNR